MSSALWQKGRSVGGGGAALQGKRSINVDRRDRAILLTIESLSRGSSSFTQWGCGKAGRNWAWES